MSIRNLDKLFFPRSIAVIGASDKPKSIGSALMANLLKGGFKGQILPVNPKATTIHGFAAYADIASLPLTPDLAVIATPPDTVPSLLSDLGRRGTRAAVVLTSGFEDDRADRKARVAQLLDAARPYLLRIVGPNCLGIALPGVGINATFVPAAALSGNIALLAQSGAVATSVLDWAEPRGIGFSAVVSLGDMIDVDFGDLLDYFSVDQATAAILIYAEAITHARKFMSAVRRAARVKPVIAIKAGRGEAAARAATSHTGALAGADGAYDAAFRRAGVLRVNEFEELFDAAATLARMSQQTGDQLTIISNGGGAGVLATDRLIAEGGRLAALSAETIAKFDSFLPSTWSRANPIDIVGDAGAERYARAVTVLLDDVAIDNILVIYCPNSIFSSTEAAGGLTGALSSYSVSAAKKNVFASWIGDANVREGRAQLSVAGIPVYETPERAVHAFMHLVRYRQSQALLLETPSSAPPGARNDVERAQHYLNQALQEQRDWLDPIEVAGFLACYGIPFARTEAARDARSATEIAGRINKPVALKVRSRHIVHKTDVGGVALDLRTSEEIEAAARQINQNVSRARPQARLEGFTVQEMVHRPGAYELIAGMTTDPTFGPLILFGHGGTAVEIIRDKSLELPPLNTALARAQIERTRIAALLKGFRGRRAANIDAVVNVLVQLSRIVAEHAEIAEVDINPLLCDADGVMAVDCRIRVCAAVGSAQSRLAIRPYPHFLESEIRTPDGKCFLSRPIRPEDEPALRRFAGEIDARALWHAFFAPLRDRSHETAARLSQVDYDREMTIVAWEGDRIAGLARSTADADFEAAECAVIVSRDSTQRGLAKQLLEALLEALAIQTVGQALLNFPASDAQMMALSRDLGFELVGGEESAIRARKRLRCRTDLV